MPMLSTQSGLREAISDPASDGAPSALSPTPPTDAAAAMLAVSRAVGKPCTLPHRHCLLDPSVPAGAARRPMGLTVQLGSTTGFILAAAVTRKLLFSFKVLNPLTAPAD